MKGVHHFDSDMSRSPRWYHSHFPTSVTKRRRTRSTGAAFTAEASPYYFFHPLAAQRAARELPDTRFAVLLRDPVERTVSHWAEQSRNGVETLPLREALEAEAGRVGDDTARLRAGTIGASHAHEQQTYAAQSEYVDSYDRWLAAVGSDRLLVLFSEDYYADPHRTLSTITDHLGVGPMRDEVASQRRNAAPRPSAIDTDLECELTARFRPDVEGLRERLGVDPPWPRFVTPR